MAEFTRLLSFSLELGGGNIAEGTLRMSGIFMCNGFVLQTRRVL